MDQSISSQPLIDIQHVTYAYPALKTTKGEQKPVQALRDISLQIQQGEHVVILGHNGSGKSTLARHCNALLLPDTGRVLVAGFDTQERAKHRAIRERIGIIFQNPDNQIIATVVEDDVAWGLTMRGWPAARIHERVEEAMAAVGMTDFRRLPPHKLSGGQRQRLAIAGILALRPQCIIADEATSMLDPFSRQELMKLLSQLNREHSITIVQVTHLLEEAYYADRVIVIEQGRIILEATPAQLFSDLARLQSLKLMIPEPIILADRLRAAGFPLVQDAVTIDAIAKELAGD
jgi:energy-coupling factor transport system ATP-binding protein